ncbi:MAG: hydrolase 1, exosortase A system-associated [Burkholderiaceae bacterium]|jgi:exosortase A-associated hydrolase 1|nr:hydrolase 1, exosortase A system-associated [Burkholderiaceae bacterium]
MTAQGGTSFDESLLIVPGSGDEMLGVLARPSPDAPQHPTGVVIVVGGPQTRVGSHRQFVLLARALAGAGYPCLRFDYTGMGDSPGPKPDFEAAEDDIRRACDALLAAAPGCRRIVLWGLCDGATAAVFHAVTDERVTAVIAANPWARSDSTRSAALVKTHYGSRLRSAEFWKKLASGGIDVVATAKELVGHVARARNGGRDDKSGSSEPLNLPQRFATALRKIQARVHLQLSGNDLTAAEFEVAMKTAGILDTLEASVLRLADADHTFSDPIAWSAVIDDTLSVLRQK